MENEKKYTAEDIEEFLKWAETQKKATVKDWEESKKEEVFKPCENQEYVIFTNELEAVKTMNSLDIDKRRIESGNCFKSVEQANKVPVKLFFAMWRWKLSNDDVEMDWKDKKDKFGIICNESINKIEILGFWASHNLLVPYFSTKEKAELCIIWLEKQNLL